MQALRKASNREGKASTQQCARELLESVPLVMRSIRQVARGRRAPGLSVPQFRTMVFLHRNPGGSLSAVADHLGLTLPTVSRLVDGLVNKGMVTRSSLPSDRRHVRLSLSPSGQTAFAAALDAAQQHLAGKLATLSESQREMICRVMLILKDLFAPTDPMVK